MVIICGGGHCLNSMNSECSISFVNVTCELLISLMLVVSVSVHVGFVQHAV